MTSTTPSRSGSPSTFCPHDPAEMLALARLMLQDVPRDSLMLIGHRGRREVIVSARIDLVDTLDDPEGTGMDRLLWSLRDNGCDGAFGLVLLGDGEAPIVDDPITHAPEAAAPDGGVRAPEGPVGPVPTPDDGVLGGHALVEEAGLAAAARVHMAALAQVPEPFDVPTVWVVSGGRAREVLADPVDGVVGEIDLAVGPLVALADLDTTRVMAQAVTRGDPIPRADGAARQRLRDRVRRALSCQPPQPLPPVEQCWDRARAAIAVLGANGRSEEQLMTACEHLAELWWSLSDPEAPDLLLRRLMSGRSTGRPVAVAGTGKALTRRPSRSIRPGGEWFRALEAMVRAVDPADLGEVPVEVGTGWVESAAVLAMLEWWNHRFHRCHELVTQVLAVDPLHPLALCLAQLTAVQIAPPWTPEGRAVRRRGDSR
ncbi:hypothetical protein JSY14_00120 [Brachybacterium sp. EF45031]|uniref:hypothetical protein n=1 Tax=Brachybacterium sillae TaxID=2810536 RepID=UPI00217CFFFC|nr:hypothetical protein [Brachybacterium sillae]MCS6710497.1 hypothetical protein [Brachybacterium sillae]